MECGVSLLFPAHLAEAVEYVDCISSEGFDTPNECPGYDTKLHQMTGAHKKYTMKRYICHLSKHPSLFELF